MIHQNNLYSNDLQHLGYSLIFLDCKLINKKRARSDFEIDLLKGKCHSYQAPLIAI